MAQWPMGGTTGALIATHAAQSRWNHVNREQEERIMASLHQLHHPGISGDIPRGWTLVGLAALGWAVIWLLTSLLG